MYKKLKRKLFPQQYYHYLSAYLAILSFYSKKIKVLVSLLTLSFSQIPAMYGTAFMSGRTTFAQLCVMHGVLSCNAC